MKWTAISNWPHDSCSYPLSFTSLGEIPQILEMCCKLTLLEISLSCSTFSHGCSPHHVTKLKTGWKIKHHLQAVMPANISANLGSRSWEKIASGFSTDFPLSWTLAGILGTGTCTDAQRKVIPSNTSHKKEFREGHTASFILLKSANALHFKRLEAQI